MLEELKEKYTKIVLWFLGLLVFISLLAHFSLQSLVEEETMPQEDSEQMIKIIEAYKRAEQEQAQMEQVQAEQPLQETQYSNMQLEQIPQQEIIENIQE